MSDELRATPMAEAKATLLRALDQLERAAQDLGREPDDVTLCVVMDAGYEDGDHGWVSAQRWSHTPGPAFKHVGLLRTAIAAWEYSRAAVDNEPDDDDEPEGGES